MRDFLFRGKRTDNGEWAYGYFYHPTGNWVRLAYKREPYMIARYDEDFLPPVEVVPKTVGEYTGLLDKNNNRIYEGDLLKVVTCGTSTTCEVVFKDGQFTGLTKNKVECDFRYLLDVEVIGNIHDSKVKDVRTN